jgi:bifunctional DNA-binding transcriptional regulator/antitoxin component of YhaV-PrlF toxin-antitoxin module
MKTRQSTLDAKGLTTVPPEVCEQLGLAPGSWVEWRVENGRILVQRVRPRKAKRSPSRHSGRAKRDPESS